MAQGRNEPFGIEDGFGLEHEIDGAGQLDGQHGVGLELVAQARFEALGQGADDPRIAFGNDGGFAKGPAEIGIAEFGSAQPLDLARAGDGAFDQAGIGEEIFDGGEAGDVADLVENGQAEIIADAGRGYRRVVASPLPRRIESSDGGFLPGRWRAGCGRRGRRFRNPPTGWNRWWRA